ncbi:MAG: 16S rRNA (cytosine(1402)-N(4))-methyltransferase RsmH [Ardenticatenaceae bacterium]|nr:16S rRNA (cytosine(1402)-N(4))-methyltransferase RsmH [Ardenticatenaceae bacterium]MCB8947039.1 16S rRNA (cytosine(1402)-N(4))-methyltransferase RsmH [Ardenticatenaceae bacterium]
MNTFNHIPVLFDEVLDLLRPQANGRYIDGTLGAGGHTAGLLQKSAPSGRVLVFDKDAEAIAFAQKQLEPFGERVTYVHASYAEMGRIAPTNGFDQVDGILLDLGLSSRQLDNAQRGFSFMKDGPLDMRFDTSQGETAADLINNLDETTLADILWRYGEEKSSRKIAQMMVAERPFTTTTQLAEKIAQTVRRRGRIHPATQTFQALRIAVNRELETVETGVMAALELLGQNGRLAVISFHSLEDRFVKQTFRQLSQDCTCPPEQPVCTCGGQAKFRLITRKAVQASAEEIAQNSRSRSARLRVIEKK